MAATDRAGLLKALAGGGALALAGCMVGPNYSPPHPKLPAAYSEPAPAPAAGASEAALETWWTGFEDPALNRLIALALQRNRDLLSAESRIREARWERVVVGGALIPELDATAGVYRGRGSKNVTIPLGGLGGSGAGAEGGGAPGGGGGAASAPPSGRGLRTEQATGGQGGAGAAGGATTGASAAPPGGPNNPLGAGGFPGVTTNLFQAGFDATWEVDLFGGTRRALQAASASLEAAEDQARAVRVSLLAEVAEDYVQLRADQTREAIARRNLSDQENLLGIARDKFRAGMMTEDQVAAQEEQVDTTRAALPAIEAAEHAARHALAFLLDEDPGELAADLGPPGALPRLPAPLPAGLPSDLLRRRPDIWQAERELAAATAEVGEAVAQLFPRFSLTGSFGWDSSTLKALPDWSSRYYSISPGIDWPVLNWAALRAEVRVQNEAEEQAFLAYRTAVAQALEEVENALVQYEMDRERRSALAAAVAASRRELTVARQSYANGLADITRTLDAERAVLQSEDTLAQCDAALRTDLIALYKALGGGWAFPAPRTGV